MNIKQSYIHNTVGIPQWTIPNSLFMNTKLFALHKNILDHVGMIVTESTKTQTWNMLKNRVDYLSLSQHVWFEIFLVFYLIFKDDMVWHEMRYGMVLNAKSWHVLFVFFCQVKNKNLNFLNTITFLKNISIKKFIKLNTNDILVRSVLNWSSKVIQ